jgi:hypothetical protein
VRRTEEELFRTSGGSRRKPPPPTIFIAYRMNNEESKTFKSDLKDAVLRYPDLSSFNIVDGHVPAGVPWAPTIRSRIASAKVVVGDVKSMRREVVFELGLAYGLGKVAIPVVSSQGDNSSLPRWIVGTQIGQYGTSQGINGLVTSIATLLSDPEFITVPRPRTPVPGLAVWLRRLNWNEHALAQFSTSAQSEELTVEVFTDDTPEDIIIRRAAMANLLVVSLDGTQLDTLMHYVCGAVAAKPTAGYGRLLSRKILIFEEPGSGGTFIAEGLRRCSDTVRVIPLTEITQKTEEFGMSYKKWLSRPKSKA